MTAKWKLHLGAAGLVMALLAAVAVSIDCGADAKQATPPPATPATSSGCSKDSDCKGERICQKGECVSPR